MGTRTHWLKGALLGAGFATVLSASPVEAHSNFSALTGGLTTEQVPCDSLCTAGPLTGGLAGQLEFTMDGMTETSNPDVVTYTGVNVITTSRGTISGPDYGIWNLVTGEFVDYTHFTSGTGDFAGASGTFVIAGKFDPVTGVGASNYIAFIRTP